jgi:hypothetical protein
MLNMTEGLLNRMPKQLRAGANEIMMPSVVPVATPRK